MSTYNPCNALPTIGDADLETLRASWGLTRRQTEVAAHIARGLTNKEVASELRCEESTVEKHVTSVFRKTGLQNRVILAAHFWVVVLVAAP